MSELQNDFDDQEIKQEPDQEVENLEQEDADLATDSDAEHEEQPQKAEIDAKQEAINKAINKKHFEAQQAKRERDELARKLAEYEEKQREMEAAKYDNIPPIPDAFDDDYEAKMAERDKALLAQAQFRAQQEAYNRQQEQLRQQQEAQKYQEFNEQVTKYGMRAKELGIPQEELQAAANTVGTLGLSDDLVRHIIADKDGPLIVRYLAANQADGIDLAQANPYSAGAKLIEIKQKASSLKPKKTGAPPPPTDISGKGAPKDLNKYPHIKGVKFE